MCLYHSITHVLKYATQHTYTMPMVYVLQVVQLVLSCYRIWSHVRNVQHSALRVVYRVITVLNAQISSCIAITVLMHVLRTIMPIVISPVKNVSKTLLRVKLSH